MLLRAVIVDDERPAINRLQQILDERKDVEVVGAFTTTLELLKVFPELLPDVAFLDIEMLGRNGLELASLLLDMHEDLEVVFVTAYNQYALEAFRVSAADYLLKPIDPGLLDRTIQTIRKRRERTMGDREEGPLRVQCFGSFIVFQPGGGKPARFPTLKAEELFAYFLIHRETNVSKWTICECLWPENEPEHAEHNLHTTVYRMKKTLRENGIRIKLEAKKGVYRFELLDSCDYLLLDRIMNQRITFHQNMVEETERVLRLYRGHLFEDKDYPWCEFEKGRILKLFTEVSKGLARWYMEAEEYQRAHDFLHFVLAKVPYEVEAHEWLLRIYAHWRDRTSFCTHYKQMSEILQREMGEVPSASVKRLYNQMIMES